MKARSQIYSLIIFFMKKTDYTVTIIVVVGLFLLTMMLVVAIVPEGKEQKPIINFTHRAMMNTAPAVYNGREHIEAIDQSVMGKVAILSAALKQNGYVVIHKEEKGKPGKIIGVSKMLTPGLYSNSSLTLTENVMPGEGLVAMLHADNGDGVFSAASDTPMKGDGMMMMSGMGMVSFMAI